MPTKKHNHVLKGKHGGMQLLLTDDVPHLGKQGELVEVKAGYARNYLLPQGKATVPTQHNLRLLDLHKKRASRPKDANLANRKFWPNQFPPVRKRRSKPKPMREGTRFGWLA